MIDNLSFSKGAFPPYSDDQKWLCISPPCVSTEDCIFTVTPASKSKIYLETPNWVEGLPSYMNVNWNISVPQKKIAQLRFLSERMGVSCDKARAWVHVKEQRPHAEEISCRHDDSLPRVPDMHYNFWINISNCKPSPMSFLSMQFSVTIADKKSGGCCVLCLVSCNIVSRDTSEKDRSILPKVKLFSLLLSFAIIKDREEKNLPATWLMMNGVRLA